MAKKEDKKTVECRYQLRNGPGGMIFVGCILVGLGLGIFFGQAAPGVLIGLGVGFLAMAAYQAKCPK